MEFDPSDYQQLRVQETKIVGFYVIDLVVHGDSRGWFKENYQSEKMEAMGLPHFKIVQNNISFNDQPGITRGLHAEPWDKFISVAHGSVYGAWVDLRKGPDFGQVLELEINPGKAVFVPRGVANGYQTQTPNTTYTYLVNGYWSSDTKYIAVNPFDPDLKIHWPINQKQALLSDKDQLNPMLCDIQPLEFLWTRLTC